MSTVPLPPARTLEQKAEYFSGMIPTNAAEIIGRLLGGKDVEIDERTKGRLNAMIGYLGIIKTARDWVDTGSLREGDLVEWLELQKTGVVHDYLLREDNREKPEYQIKASSVIERYIRTLEEIRDKENPPRGNIEEVYSLCGFISDVYYDALIATYGDEF